MATHVILHNPITNETKTVKVGFSWVLFLFSSFWGIPLFLRGLHIQGGAMVAISALITIFSWEPSTDADLVLFLAIGGLFICIMLGIKGNEMTAKNYLNKGWKIFEPDSIAAKHARYKWGLAETSPTKTENDQ